MAADMDPEPTGAIHLGKVEKKKSFELHLEK
jgi:hypothetical protein